MREWTVTFKGVEVRVARLEKSYFYTNIYTHLSKLIYLISSYTGSSYNKALREESQIREGHGVLCI